MALFFASILITSSLTSSLVFAQNVTALSSPLKQFKSGVALKDIICNSGLKLLYKVHDGLPLCVKSSTLSKFIDRGIATTAIEPNLAIYPSVAVYVEKDKVYAKQYNVDARIIAKYPGLREALESADKVYELNLGTCRKIDCGNLSMAIPPGYIQPSHFQLPADLARKMVNDPLLNFHSFPVKGTDLTYYETRMELGNSTYHIYLDL